ncbi:MAG TPA: cytochrome c [Gammaproteobacteria bacterium]|nr:cytochrome c [Gammaproteobacteria bacterium]
MRRPQLRGAAALLAAIVVVAIDAAAAQTARKPAATSWDGVYTTEQAQRGQVAYTGPCDRCHGYKLDGASEDPDMLPAPPVAGPKFLRKWNGRSLAVLLEYLRTTMPSNNPGYLSDGEVADVVAYMLATSGVPAGSEPLRPELDVLAAVVIASPPQ